jgi:phosphocarrier protein
MATRCVVVGSKVGLHARPAALFVQAANRLPVKMMIANEGMKPIRAALSSLGGRGGSAQGCLPGV